MTSTHKFINIMHKLGTEQKPVSKVYRRMLDLDLFVAAYTELARNEGRLTPGTDGETIDGTSIAKLEKLIEKLRNKSFKWTPTRRIYIAKANGKKRPISMPSWEDKLVQRVLKMVLEAYYEPIFNDRSHGFRPARGCHTALLHIRKFWQGTKWFIEGDIAGCFDNIPHEKLLTILGRRIQDNQILSLIKNMLRAGYMEAGIHNNTQSGTPQGGIVSPILANILLHELDEYVMNTLVPEFNQGKHRKKTRAYGNAAALRIHHTKRGNIQRAKEVRKAMRFLPYSDEMDPHFKRLDYVRYADDFILRCIGSKEDATQIKDAIAKYLETELGLTLSAEKTLITNAKHERARFLGYEIGVIYGERMALQRKTKGGVTKRRSVNGQIQLYVPQDVREKWVREFQRKGKAIHLNRYLGLSDFEIIEAYGAKWRGLHGYYALASNIHSLRAVEWAMLQSCQKTLAGKHKTTTSKIREQYQTQVNGKVCFMCEVPNPNNPQNPLRAFLGGLPLKVQRDLDIGKYDDIRWQPQYGRTELTTRLKSNVCELCGSTDRVQAHHIKSIKEAKRKYRHRQEMPKWVEEMTGRHRNTLIVCHQCHWNIHRGKYDGSSLRKR